MKLELWCWVNQGGDSYSFRTTLQSHCSSAQCDGKKNGKTCTALCKICKGFTCWNTLFNEEEVAVPTKVDFDNFEEDSGDLILMIPILRAFNKFQIIQYDIKNIFLNVK